MHGLINTHPSHQSRTHALPQTKSFPCFVYLKRCLFVLQRRHRRSTTIYSKYLRRRAHPYIPLRHRSKPEKIVRFIRQVDPRLATAEPQNCIRRGTVRRGWRGSRMAHAGNAGLRDPLLLSLRFQQFVIPAGVILAASSDVQPPQGVILSGWAKRSARPNLPLLPAEESLFRHPIPSSTPSSDPDLPCIPPRQRFCSLIPLPLHHSHPNPTNLKPTSSSLFHPL